MPLACTFYLWRSPNGLGQVFKERKKACEEGEAIPESFSLLIRCQSAVAASALSGERVCNPVIPLANTDHVPKDSDGALYILPSAIFDLSDV